MGRTDRYGAFCAEHRVALQALIYLFNDKLLTSLYDKCADGGVVILFFDPPCSTGAVPPIKEGADGGPQPVRQGEAALLILVSIGLEFESTVSARKRARTEGSAHPSPSPSPSPSPTTLASP